MEEADKLHNQTTQENAKNVQQDALKAQEMRQLALETLAETTKRKSEEPKSETKKKIQIFWVRNTCLLMRESWKRSRA